jgi:hypothetical protein
MSGVHLSEGHVKNLRRYLAAAEEAMNRSHQLATYATAVDYERAKRAHHDALVELTGYLGAVLGAAEGVES